MCEYLADMHSSSCAGSSDIVVVVVVVLTLTRIVKSVVTGQAPVILYQVLDSSLFTIATTAVAASSRLLPDKGTALRTQ